MASPFDAPLLAAATRLDELRGLLMFHDNLRSHPRSNELARTSRAWAYVAMAATLEEFVRGFLDELTLYINGAGLTLNDVNLGVVSLVAASDFDSAPPGGDKGCGAVGRPFWNSLHLRRSPPSRAGSDH